MCGRFVSVTDPDGLVRFFVVDERDAPDLGARYNVAPSLEVYAVVQREERRVLTNLRWGLVPFWAKDPSVGNRHINARAETLAQRSAYRDAFERRRCLIPADGFYEWQRQPGGGKTPYFVHRADGAPLALAGLWARWRDRADPGASPLESCTIVTGRPNALVARLHDRMPVILERDDWATWLSPDADPDTLSALLRPVDERLLEAYPVGREVGDVRNDHPALIEPQPAPAEPGVAGPQEPAPEQQRLL